MPKPSRSRIFGKDRPSIAVPFADKNQLSTIRRLRKAGMDVAELRIDLFSSRDESRVIREARKFKGVPTIATIRSQAEGGKWRGTDAERLALFLAVLPHVDALDVEWSSRALVEPLVREARRRKKAVIISFHDFKKTPDPAFLLKLARSAKAAGADAVKIAAMARTRKDMRSLAQFTFQHAALGLITLSMGKEGAISRLFFPGLGSLLTFAHAGRRTAPGQMDLATTAACFRKFHGPR